MLQCVAVCCSVLQCVAVCRSYKSSQDFYKSSQDCVPPCRHLALPTIKVDSIFNALQHTATHCNTLQHTATQCHTLRHTQHTATHCNTRKVYWIFQSTLQRMCLQSIFQFQKKRCTCSCLLCKKKKFIHFFCRVKVAQSIWFIFKL